MKWLKYLIPFYGLIKLLDPNSDIYDWDDEMIWGVLLAWYQLIIIFSLVSWVVKLVI